MQTTISGCVTTTMHKGEVYRITTKEGVRGMNIPAIATLEGKEWKVSVSGKQFTVVEAVKLVPQRKRKKIIK